MYPLFTAIAIFIADQVSKRLILTWFSTGEILPLAGSWLSFTRITNNGCSFGLTFGNGTTQFLISFSLVVMLFFMAMRSMLPDEARLQKWSISLILGGTMGNLLDRLLYGKVVDFIQVRTLSVQWPVFNIADMAIVLGVSIYCGLYLSGGMHDYRSRSASCSTGEESSKLIPSMS
ncbi:MAG: signal peptidase II [Candidatus Wallbacteria bacterium HGW-Wallbacteria-1]|jgi:signal peptidase II|uniref:Lipoprotein signal peptidase n=1 Tax=Candidatus Wallbacteria bacterium HGW-Wallbacteria-1 TaxID=2013854 RepID=A0A2N1PJR7_9BACT|nr:MAG: signal peptidase II [Candidatus Wallbacteria bacterium HGW-Wallbacteria-1]